MSRATAVVCSLLAAASLARPAVAQEAPRSAVIGAVARPIRPTGHLPAAHPPAIDGPAGAAWLRAAPAGATPVRAPDSWIAEDKARHLVASFTLTAFAFAGANALGVDWPGSGAAAGSIAFGGGVAKELRDGARGRAFSPRDLAWDVLGVGAALLLASRAR